MRFLMVKDNFPNISSVTSKMGSQRVRVLHISHSNLTSSLSALFLYLCINFHHCVSLEF